MTACITSVFGLEAAALIVFLCVVIWQLAYICTDTQSECYGNLFL